MRSTQKELLDDFSLSGADLEKNLQNLHLANRFLGGNALIIQAITQIIGKQPDLTQRALQIADLGCGGGDILRTLAQWANKKSLNWQWHGIDANPAIIKFARQQSVTFPNIHYQAQNIFSAEFKSQKFDIILLCTVCHHFSDEELVVLFSQLKQQANIAIIISDLHRHWFAYYATQFLSHMGQCSYLEKHDAPLSVRKAFIRPELTQLLHQAGIHQYQIKWCWPFRYRVLIEK